MRWLAKTAHLQRVRGPYDEGGEIVIGFVIGNATMVFAEGSDGTSPSVGGASVSDESVGGAKHWSGSGSPPSPGSVSPSFQAHRAHTGDAGGAERGANFTRKGREGVEAAD